MSETPEETPDETQEPDETPTPTPDEEDEEQESEETPAQAAAREGSADIPKKLERALNDQRKRLEKIIGVELAGKECPTCDGMGYLPQGAEEAPEAVHPENLVTCEKCNGYGEVITGSRHPDHVTAMCIACAGNGFITKAEQPANVTNFPTYTPPAPVTAEQAQMGTMMPDGTFVPFVNTATIGT